MKKLFLLLLSNIISLTGSFGCTTFFLNNNGEMVFGKNYDWMTGIGSINTNLRGLTKRSLPLEPRKSLQWVSKYGSITFNQYGKEFPNGGMNEKGLVIELMWLNETEYPVIDMRPGLSVLQWIQFQLDNCATVEEVLANDKTQRIVSTGTPQHYLVADAMGGVAAIEFLKGKIVIHRGRDLPYPALANSSYENSVKALNSKNVTDNSLERFSKACSMIKQYRPRSGKKAAVDYSFDMLSAVAQPNFTKWSIVYDITHLKIYFKTSAYASIKAFGLNNFDFGCTAIAQTYDMNRDDENEISKKFLGYDNETNKKMLKAAFRASEGLNISEKLQEMVAEYPLTIHCL